jgi:hypothetical protein
VVEFEIPKTYVAGTEEGCRNGGRMFEVSRMTANDGFCVVASVLYTHI